MSEESPKRKCANEGCVCELDEGQTYCGPFCATTAGDTIALEQPCACGHVGCARPRGGGAVDGL